MARSSRDWPGLAGTSRDWRGLAWTIASFVGPTPLSFRTSEGTALSHTPIRWGRISRPPHQSSTLRRAGGGWRRGRLERRKVAGGGKRHRGGGVESPARARAVGEKGESVALHIHPLSLLVTTPIFSPSRNPPLHFFRLSFPLRLSPSIHLHLPFVVCSYPCEMSVLCLLPV